jgi:hypothetical protein
VVAVVVTTAVVVVVGACVELVGGTVASTVEAGAAGGELVVVEAGALRGVVGGVTPICGTRGPSVVGVADWGTGGGAVVAVVDTAGVAVVGVVVVSDDGTVVWMPAKEVSRWPRATSSNRALRQNSASVYTTTFSRYPFESPAHHRPARSRCLDHRP